MSIYSYTRRAFLKSIGLGLMAPVFAGSVYGKVSGEQRPNIVFLMSDEHPHCTSALGEAGVEYIRLAAKAGKPFCLQVWFKPPHHPYNPDPCQNELYATHRKFTKPPNYGRKNGEHLAPHIRLGEEYPRFFGYGWEEKRYNETASKYYRLLHGIDLAVGRIRSELEKQGVADNTVIIYTSDNGYHVGHLGLGGKVLPYESAVNVPMIIYDPRSESVGKEWRSSEICGNIDLAATILDLANLKIPKQMDGKSMLPMLDDPNYAIREHLLVTQMTIRK